MDHIVGILASHKISLDLLQGIAPFLNNIFQELHGKDDYLLGKFTIYHICNTDASKKAEPHALFAVVAMAVAAPFLGCTL